MNLMMKKFVVPVVLLAVIVGGGIVCDRHKTGGAKSIEEDLGVPLYPGAQEVTDGFSKHLSERDRKRLIKAKIYTTDDSSDKVIKFYKEKLDKGKTKIIETSRRGIPEGVIRTDIGDTPRFVMIVNNEDTNKTEITISSIDPATASR
jgi:hypothetical protein